MAKSSIKFFVVGPSAEGDELFVTTDESGNIPLFTSMGDAEMYMHLSYPLTYQNMLMRDLKVPVNKHSLTMREFMEYALSGSVGETTAIDPLFKLEKKYLLQPVILNGRRMRIKK